MMYLRHVSWPWALSLVVLLPVFTAWMVLHARRVHAKRLSHLGTPRMIARLAPATVRTSRWRPVRLGLAVFFAAIALAGPRWGVEQTVVKQAGIDVVLALDASNSMLARDEAPDRLTKMKEVVNRLRDLSPTDRFSIVAFAGSAYVLSPLTIDDAALNLFLDNLDPTVVGQAGSSLSSALTMSMRLLASSKPVKNRESPEQRGDIEILPAPEPHFIDAFVRLERFREFPFQKINDPQIEPCRGFVGNGCNDTF